MSKQELIRKIQELSFTLVELNLFLDTHPDNAAARRLYNERSAQMAEAREQYFAAFGPLMNFGVCPAGDSYAWVNSPWPWEA